MRSVLIPLCTAALLAALALGCTAQGVIGLRSGEDRILPTDAESPSHHDADVDERDTGTRQPDASTVPMLRFVSPTDAHLVRSSVIRHQWSAQLDTVLAVEGIHDVVLSLDDEEIGTLGGAPWTFPITLVADGTYELRATGRDADGATVASATKTLTVTSPSDTSCHAMLDALGLDWSPAGDERGVDDPVYVQPTINGVSFRYTSSSTASRMMMDCSLAPRLYEVAELAKSFGFDEIEHIGIYNYRCIGGGDPDTGCTPSMHAYARAIDFHSFNNTRTGAASNVETDWIVTEGDVCGEPTRAGEDQTLHELACGLAYANIFNIILTPDYNADHRNHFHVDLTAGADYIGLSVRGIDPMLPGLGD